MLDDHQTIIQYDWCLNKYYWMIVIISKHLKGRSTEHVCLPDHYWHIVVPPHHHHHQGDHQDQQQQHHRRHRSHIISMNNHNWRHWMSSLVDQGGDSAGSHWGLLTSNHTTPTSHDTTLHPPDIILHLHTILHITIYCNLHTIPWHTLQFSTIPCQATPYHTCNHNP